MRRINGQTNSVKLYRKRMSFSQKRVAVLLGHRDSSLLCLFESGRKFPTLGDALRLGIVLRVPVEFLFPKLYDGLRLEIRAKEDSLDFSTRSPLTHTRHVNP
jgi:transcriptional regulator with XRE-family HTH domain